jgi:hypothetical protein
MKVCLPHFLRILVKRRLEVVELLAFKLVLSPFLRKASFLE